MSGNNVSFLWTNPSIVSRFQAGVSLHSHTMHSKESLSFVPEYAARIPLLDRELTRLRKKYQVAKGRDFDFAGSYWTPPLHSHAAFDVERKQIEDVLGLPGFVSLSDHDSIAAGTQLQVLDTDIPISVEWTVPIGPTYFHLGVHNLRPDASRGLMASLAGYTSQPRKELLVDLLDALNASPETLVIFNHPLWDQTNQGMTEHKRYLRELLAIAGHRIHAMELNGLRPWAENRAVSTLSAETNYPLISGGDRHGHEPNAILNLTSASNFGDFVQEVRTGVSHVVFMPQYREPLSLRCIKTLCDVLRYMPDMAGHERWTDRVYYSPAGEEHVPISSAMRDEGPAILRYFVAATSLLGHRRVQSALRSWLTQNQEYAL